MEIQQIKVSSQIMLSVIEIKKKVGEQASLLVQQNMTIGIGTGSTAHFLIIALAARMKQGLHFRAVPTSLATKSMATDSGIPLVELNDVSSIDLAIDGADEIDPKLQLIKGGGGALVQEKMVAAAANQFVVIADNSKLVQQLGAFPLPVEVIPYGWKQVQRRIQQWKNITVQLREQQGQPFVTDHGHFILDCHFQRLENLPSINDTLKSIPGVVDNGLFLDMAHSAIIGYPDGSLHTLVRQ